MDASVDAELDQLISRRASRDQRPDPDEEHELWRESVRAYTAQRREELRTAWCEYHQGQAQQLRRTVEPLIAFHEARAALLDDETS
jgi:hypothetical protein